MRALKVTMETYFFHVRRQVHRIPDLEGSELPDDEAAVSYARAAARELARDSLMRSEETGVGAIDVVTASGRQVASVFINSTIHQR